MEESKIGVGNQGAKNGQRCNTYSALRAFGIGML